ncbi:MAG TPA: hypothetical protein VM680_15000 [Verrucomicrobiae bacterium]|nr:hypothetical protein [Verrucomicrobiae bacterium]
MDIQTASPRFSTDAIADTNTTGVTQRVEFRGNPGLYAKKLAAVGVVLLIAIALTGYFYLGERNPKFYLFACGLSVAVLVGRYFSMMGLNGPPALIFDTKGITIQKGKKTTEIAWADLQSVRNEVIRGGQLWEIAWTGGKFDYFIDGLTGEQKAGLKATFAKIKLPHVTVRLEHYDTV